LGYSLNAHKQDAKRTAHNELNDWQDIQFFLAVAHTGSFFKAARSLRTNRRSGGESSALKTRSTLSCSIVIPMACG